MSIFPKDEIPPIKKRIPKKNTKSRKPTIDPDVAEAAKAKSKLRHPGEPKPKRKAKRENGKPLSKIPIELYIRGIPRSKALITGPQETINAFNDYCDQHDLAKWEALELLMRYAEPKFVVKHPTTKPNR